MLTLIRQSLLPPCHIVGGIDVVGVSFAGYFRHQFGANSYEGSCTFIAIVGELIPQFGMNAHGVASRTVVRGNGNRSNGVGNLSPCTRGDTGLIAQAHHHAGKFALACHSETALQ